MTNPATCSPVITEYIAMSLARSWAVIAVNDCRSSCPMRGDLTALTAAPRAGTRSGRAFISVAGLYQRRMRGASHGGQPAAPAPHLVAVVMPVGSCLSTASWRQRDFHRFLRPFDLTMDKERGQFSGRGESSRLSAHVFHVLHCLLGGI